MEMKHSLHLSQTQKLIMTPRLQQALEVLQNPLLEEVDEVTEQEDIEREASADEQNNEEPEDPAEEDPIDWSDYLQDGSLDRTYVPPSESSVEFLEKVPATRTTLAENLLEQLHFLNLPAEHMRIAEFIVGSIDDRGWLVTPLAEIAESLGRPPVEIENVLRLV